MRLDDLHHSFRRTLGVAVVLAAVCTAAPAQTTLQAAAPVTTTANGPYYAMPAWDQTFTAYRFIVLANFRSEAVLDRETGLVWERTPRSARNLHFAHVIGCAAQTTGGRRGWRLPTIDELTSLSEPSVTFPTPELPAGHPFVLGEEMAFWSATTVTFLNGGQGALWFSPTTGSIFVASVGSPPFEQARAWCVRGGSR